MYLRTSESKGGGLHIVPRRGPLWYFTLFFLGVRIHSHGSNTTWNSGEFPRYVIYLLFDFRKLRIFRCFPFPENSRTPTFPISGNSGLRRFLLLVIHSCISPFTCDSVVSPCFMLLFSFMYSGLPSVPGTYLFHSLVYKHLYSVARIPELRLLSPLLFLSISSLVPLSS